MKLHTRGYNFSNDRIIKVNKQQVSIKATIRDNKLKRIKLREDLRLFRKLGNVNITSTEISAVHYVTNDLLESYKTLKIGTVVLKLLDRSRTGRPKLALNIPTNSQRWSFEFYKSNLLDNAHLAFENKPISTSRLSISSLLYHDMTSNFPKLIERSYTLPSSVDRILIMDNKPSQLYLTSLSKRKLRWHTDVTLSPGVVSPVFLGAKDKHLRSMFKKKDKNLIKVLLKSFKVILPKFIGSKSKLMVEIRRKPKSLEVYDTFLRLINAVLGTHPIITVLQPKVRHTFIKLRKYARIKRRLRKTVTAKLSEISTNNKLRIGSCEISTSDYSSKIVRLFKGR